MTAGGTPPGPKIGGAGRVVMGPPAPGPPTPGPPMTEPPPPDPELPGLLPPGPVGPWLAALVLEPNRRAHDVCDQNVFLDFFFLPCCCGAGASALARITVSQEVVDSETARVEAGTVWVAVIPITASMQRLPRSKRLGSRFMVRTPFKVSV
jgi:hypothetical protein